MAGKYDEMKALCERARQTCAETKALHQQLAITRQETRALVEQARAIDPRVIWSVGDAPPMLPTHDAIYLPWDEPNEAALDTLRIMRTLIAEYPVEWQVKLVKVLAARTAAVAYEHLHTRQALSA